MKVYFSGALYTQDDFQPRYKKIIGCLTGFGFEVMEDTTVTSFLKFEKLSENRIVDNYKKIQKWIDKCDFAVFEASFPSTLSIGHEISLVLGRGKPVVIMYLENRSPKFLLGCKNNMIIWTKYNDRNIVQSLTKALEDIKKKVNVRFNFFVPKNLITYLDRASKEMGVNKSEYLRMLIEKEVRKK